MRTLLLLLFAVSASAQNFPILNGRLESNFDGNSFHITNAASVRATTLYGALGLTNLLSGGASENDVLRYDGTNWVPGAATVNTNSITRADVTNVLTGTITNDITGNAATATLASEASHAGLADAALWADSAGSLTNLFIRADASGVYADFDGGAPNIEIDNTGIRSGIGFAGPGTDLTALNAAALSFGMVPVSRLGTNGASSGNILQTDGTNLFWGTGSSNAPTAGVSSFNTRTGDVTLTSGDVTNAMPAVITNNTTGWSAWATNAAGWTNVFGYVDGNGIYGDPDGGNWNFTVDNTGVSSTVGFSGPGGGLTGISSNSITAETDAAYRGVTSWNSRTGDVTLTRADVTNALTGTITNEITTAGAVEAASLKATGLSVGKMVTTTTGGLLTTQDITRDIPVAGSGITITTNTSGGISTYTVINQALPPDISSTVYLAASASTNLFTLPISIGETVVAEFLLGAAVTNGTPAYAKFFAAATRDQDGYISTTLETLNSAGTTGNIELITNSASFSLQVSGQSQNGVWKARGYSLTTTPP